MTAVVKEANCQAPENEIPAAGSLYFHRRAQSSLEKGMHTRVHVRGHVFMKRKLWVQIICANFRYSHQTNQYDANQGHDFAYLSFRFQQKFAS